MVPLPTTEWESMMAWLIGFAALGIWLALVGIVMELVLEYRHWAFTRRVRAAKRK